MTHLERAIRSQSAELARVAAYDLASFATRLERRGRVWLVGTGSSQHAAEMGALLLAEAGLDARWAGSWEFVRLVPKPGPGDAVILISHTARTSFAVAAREAALASGAQVVSITGIGGGWPEAIETVAMEQSETYSVSVTAALMVLFRLAHELGAEGLSRGDLEATVERVRTVIEETEVPAIELPNRAMVLVGSGAGAVSAREGALKLREAAHVLAEGYGSEYLLHGQAVPLQPDDSLLLIGAAADRDGLLLALGEAASAEGLAVASIDEPAIDHLILAQLPTIVRLQLLALSFSRARSTDPDKAIAGHWAEEAMWAIGRPRK
jgi:glucosamine--fructose-6-phosphate aminotransferase (isomerizing)